MTLGPAAPGQGIRFYRKEGSKAAVEIPATWRYVVDTRMCTRIGLPGGPHIATVEHLMAALAGSEIDNAAVTIDGPEVPVMDGSAAPFMFLIECAGIVDQEATRRAIEILKPVTVGSGDRHATLTPSRVPQISFDIDFDSPAICRQKAAFTLVNGTFKSEISRARTFGFLHEIDQLRAAGLARGGSLDNAVVVSGEHILNEDGLRYDDEFVRHKMLDAVGDLYLAGAPVIGHFHGVQSGHHLTHQLLVALFADDSNWRWTDMPSAYAAEAAKLALPA
jgi:UDP-3-O-[3-hydroxymyristoyl] N-acetylglucosamine deacetylase